MKREAAEFAWQDIDAADAYIYVLCLQVHGVFKLDVVVHIQHRLQAHLRENSGQRQEASAPKRRANREAVGTATAVLAPAPEGGLAFRNHTILARIGACWPYTCAMESPSITALAQVNHDTLEKTFAQLRSRPADPL